MLVAVLDDGLDTRFIPEEKIVCDLCVGEDGTIREKTGEDALQTHHGSTVAGIILRYAPDTTFCSLRIFYNGSLSAARRQLEASLNWCLEHRIPVVHLSAGTKNMADYDSLRPIVARMVLQGQIIVAAHSNSAGYCMPACLSGVFCVRADAAMRGFSYAADIQENGMAFRASARHEAICGEDVILANSYAAPTVTAAVCLNYEEFSSVRNGGQALYRKLTGGNPLYRTPDFVENAVVVNRGGEMLPQEAFFFGMHKDRAWSSIDYADCQRDSEDSLKKVLVWIPEKEGELQEESELIREADKADVAGIMYCGTLTQPTRLRLHKYLVWEAPEGKKEGISKEGEQDSQGQAMLPLVMIIGRRNEAICFGAALRKLFLQEGYSCVCVSDLPMPYLYGMYDVPSGVFGTKELEVIRQSCHPDIVFCCSEHWMEGIGAFRYFVIDLSGVCEKTGIIANLDFSAIKSGNATETAKNQIMDYTWPD